MTSRRTPSLIGAATVAVLALTGCGSSSTSSSAPPRTAAPANPSGGGPSAKPAGAASSSAGVTQLSADPSGALKFNVSTLHAKAGTVTLQMMNPAGSNSRHGIAVQGNGVDKDSAIVQPGATAAVTAMLKPGTYAFYCPVPGHEAAGMKGTLIVT